MGKETVVDINKSVAGSAKNSGKEKNAPLMYEPIVCTSITLYPFKEGGRESKTKAFAKVVLSGQLICTGLRVMLGQNGYFVSYPSDPYYKSEEYHSIYYPLNKELRDHIEQCVLEKYQELGTAEMIADQK